MPDGQVIEVTFDDKITVSEMFGPTVQGEGPTSGRPAMFLRLGLCNLDCSWCDTPYTWDWTGKNGRAYDRQEELRRIDVKEVVDWFIPRWSEKIGRLVISGGEPLLQRRPLTKLVALLDRVDIEIETNGTIVPPIGLLDKVQWNVSPKLPGSGVDSDKAIRPEIIRVFNATPNHCYKFVITSYQDVQLACDLVADHQIDPKRVWLMPEGRTTQDLNDRLPDLIEVATMVGFNVGTRLHVLAYGDRRGV